MSAHRAAIHWARGGQGFLDQRYSRAHVWRFDGGVEVRASSSPDVVPLPLSDASAVDPEEAFVASVSSCHMLWFLSIAAERGFVVDGYTDDAEGIMGPDADGQMVIVRVTLRPKTVFSGIAPSKQALHDMHHAAHRSCFIANSIKSEIVCEPNMAKSTAPVRTATHGDAAAAVAVLRRSIVELCAPDHKNDVILLDKWLANKTAGDFHRWLDSPGNYCVVTESEAGVNGVGLITRDGEIRLCYVAPGSTGVGCGSTILAALEKQALAWRVGKLTLASTTLARQFYEKHGYVPSLASYCSFGVQCYPYEKVLS